ncbi:MAG: asparagine synthase (glutamine-hydrolyzing) [Verrucomicrobiales bacterium]
MCGIAGIYHFVAQEPVERGLLERMARSITHRGPDDEGYFIDGELGFGFRRLSIIDLGGGHQPMADAEESVWVVFNGEIYNFPELRAELESKGHHFRTHSDTEVIIHGYKEWGTGVLGRLNGMFGLGIWDVALRRLVVARDAMGIKLVYYRLTAGTLTFGSEIRAVQAASDESLDPDPEAVGLFLRFRYTPAPLTIYRGIQKLAPGMMLVAEDGRCREERWYDHTPRPFDPPKSDADAEAELLDIYRGAVKRHLLSDVPVGLLLSGGLDSGLLLALMNECGRDWPTYTVGYGDIFADDELRDAAETAAILGSKHTTVRLDQDEYERALPGIVASLEEPVTSSSIVPMYFVCQRARADVKVALIGQGPDELFGGYKRHLGVHYGGVWRSLPSALRQLAAAVVTRLPRLDTLKRGARSLGTADRLQRYQDVFALAANDTVASLFRDGALPGTPGVVAAWRDLLPQMQPLDELGGFQLLEVRSSLPEELLMFGDKLSMAHGLEARVPYLDRTVVEYAQRLHSHLKVRRGKGKWLHRQVCRNFLPPPILRRKKRGFAVNVVDGWFHSSLQGALTQSLLDPQSLMYRFLQPGPVRSLLDAHRTGKQDNHKLLFSLVMLEQCLRTMAGSPQPTPPIPLAV